MNLIFRSINGEVKSINVIIDDTPIANKWKSLLCELLKNKDIVYQKNFSILGNITDYRSRSHIVNDLLNAIEILKDFNYNIPEDFSLLKIEYNQNLLNSLHKHFENLHGQIWNPSEHLLRSTGEQSYAISMLNFCCHELEAYYDSLNKNNLNPNIYFYYNVLGVTRRDEITIEDKGYFTTKMTPGMVYLHYAQTGKTHYEAYLDDDTDVSLENISEHRLISGEFCIYFGLGYELPKDKDFTNWLLSKGFDLDDPTLALGFCPIGRVDLDNYQEFFSKYNDFLGIELSNNCQIYDYRHNDLDFKNKLINLWNKKDV
jgi:hypothetical protein